MSESREQEKAQASELQIEDLPPESASPEDADALRGGLLSATGGETGCIEDARTQTQILLDMIKR